MLSAPPREAAVQPAPDILIQTPLYPQCGKQQGVIQYIRADGKPIRPFCFPDALLRYGGRLLFHCGRFGWFLHGGFRFLLHGSLFLLGSFPFHFFFGGRRLRRNLSRRDTERHYHQVFIIIVRTRVIGGDEIGFFQSFAGDKFRLHAIGTGECRVQVLFSGGQRSTVAVHINGHVTFRNLRLVMVYQSIEPFKFRLIARKDKHLLARKKTESDYFVCCFLCGSCCSG